MSRLLTPLFILGLFALCAVSLGFGGSVVNTFVPHTTQGEEIKMVQPSGWWLSRDAYAAQEVNVPNSQANENNGQMHALNAQATLTVEKANSLRAEAARLNNQQFKQGQNTGMLLGLCFGGVCILIIGFIVVVLLRRGGGQ